MHAKLDEHPTPTPTPTPTPSPSSSPSPTPTPHQVHAKLNEMMELVKRLSPVVRV